MEIDSSSQNEPLPYPVKKDGTPDMRFTRNPFILKMKMDKIKEMEKEKN